MVIPRARNNGSAADEPPKPKPGGISPDALEQADPEKEKAFIESITSGKFHNQAAMAAESTLSTILGRQAAYAQREITWDELLASNQTYDAELEGIDLSEFE